MAFCTGCGENISDEAKFCIKCGKPTTENTTNVVLAEEKAAAAATTVPPTEIDTGSGDALQPVVKQAHPPKPVPQPVVIENNPSAAYNANAWLISTGGYVLMMLLFAIPLIGWLICIIMAFAPKNPNRKNFAKANLIFLIIGIILMIIIWIAFLLLGNSIMDNIKIQGGF